MAEQLGTLGIPTNHVLIMGVGFPKILKKCVGHHGLP